MKQTQATASLGEQLREKLGYILLFEVSDPRLDLVTNLRHRGNVCRARVRRWRTDTTRSWRRSQALRAVFAACWLARSIGVLRPSSIFGIDRSTDEAERITRALENVPATLAIEKDEDGYPIADAAQEAALDD